MNEIHSLRNEYAADVCLLLAADQPGGKAQDIGKGEDVAYAVVDELGFTGGGLWGYLVGHEMGHLFGARHDLVNDGASVPFPYGHGYRNPDNMWADIMSLPNPCAPGCTRIPYFSNPPDLTHPNSGPCSP